MLCFTGKGASFTNLASESLSLALASIGAVVAISWLVADIIFFVFCQRRCGGDSGSGAGGCPSELELDVAETSCICPDELILVRSSPTTIDLTGIDDLSLLATIASDGVANNFQNCGSGEGSASQHEQGR